MVSTEDAEQILVLLASTGALAWAWEVSRCLPGRTWRLGSGGLLQGSFTGEVIPVSPHPGASQMGGLWAPLQTTTQAYAVRPGFEDSGVGLLAHASAGCQPS